MTRFKCSTSEVITGFDSPVAINDSAAEMNCYNYTFGDL